jgi:hypothetical protein
MITCRSSYTSASVACTVVATTMGLAAVAEGWSGCRISLESCDKSVSGSFRTGSSWSS